mgnify:CR=1 FL=1
MKTLLIADLNSIGFLKKYRKRLELLGFKIIVPRYFDDMILLAMAEAYNGFVVTFDTDFLGYDRAIVLPKKKWEVCVTFLIKELVKKLGR